MLYRIGLGTDLHRLEDGIPLILAGVVIPFHKGPAGHSDGDAVAHAVCDALFGAVALHDIGYHFPDTDPAFKGASSMKLLKECTSLVRLQGWKPENIDVVIHLESPKLAPYIEQMRQSLSGATGMDLSAISIKAKTGEKIGLVGEGSAVEVMAICLVSPV
jgi:2-C-methyl-D-erythritol 2,4-cyclodiphosphate synthase